ncbi:MULTISPECIES: DUF1361 domain-containing protein [Staphylococcus]|uniref:DUF1361 domain-containing protein n=1 Tax=Staphylococcus agnetis TaxID=985762 RepID=A0A2T4MLE2_9STAP|nr:MULTISPECIES: DUF1361 domain-containing protein [Staphylococcus]NHM92191.1 DUF1361 domain-containing protein [Staphylococcus sp. 10602379]NJI02037.1 DUF1361 domain-containing protein [Staphylococcus agnetis]NJI13343.1 DUF1361 domain-containing protein [Staphylococcus agnetis]PTH16231.1 DUF1361 domain-containing protein [Staphylococcus agnetis]PTH30495.1 DUF1361 domain-containing protein [Staphylococcus agnetis]
MQARYIARLLYVFLFVTTLVVPNHFKFLLLNLTLAYIPLELAYLLKLFVPKRLFEWPLFVIYLGIFILMLPNTFYMVTDLIHLNQFSFSFLSGLVLIEWIHFGLLVTGVLFAVYCFTLIALELFHLPFPLWTRYIILLGMTLLNGLGIYVGRFLRFHSVHLINNPFSVVISTLKSIDAPAITFIGLIALMQCLLLLCLKGVRTRS